MALERDNQEILAVEDKGIITLTDGAEVQSGAVDTKGMRALTFTWYIASSGPLVPGDDIHCQAQESADNATWTDVPSYKLLPSEHYPDQHMVNPIAPYAQTLGVVNTERYVRMNFDCINVQARQGFLQVELFAIMHPELRAFRAWDPASLTGDGLP